MQLPENTRRTSTFRARGVGTRGGQGGQAAPPPSFQKTQKVPSLSGDKIPFAFFENVVQIAFIMIAK